MKFARNLKFEEEPNFSFIKNQLRTMFETNNYKYDLVFDWVIPAPKPSGTLVHLLDHQRGLRNKQEREERKTRGHSKAQMYQSSPYDQSSLAVNYTTRNGKDTIENLDYSALANIPINNTQPQRSSSGQIPQDNKLQPIVERKERKQSKRCGCRLL